MLKELVADPRKKLATQRKRVRHVSMLDWRKVAVLRYGTTVITKKK